MRNLTTTLALALLTPAALAQPSNISASHKMSWSENTGWMNWRDAGSPEGTTGVRVLEDHLAGLVWSENTGWINLGPGSGPYNNTSGTDFGVNLEPATGNLSGNAWGENIGWIQFDTTSLTPYGDQARFDTATRRFHGYAWSPNVGWINLDDAQNYVALRCPADLNDDGFLDNGDIGEFIALFFAGNLVADMNADGFLDNGDIGLFVAAFLAGC